MVSSRNLHIMSKFFLSIGSQDSMQMSNLVEGLTEVVIRGVEG